MALDPASLCRVADRVAADESAKRDAELQPKRQTAAAEFPALFARFLRQLEGYVEAVAACGLHSVRLLCRNTNGSDHLYVPGAYMPAAFGDAKGPAVTRAQDAANTLLGKIQTLNCALNPKGCICWGSD